MPQELYSELIDRLSSVRRRRERVDLSIGMSRSLTEAILIILFAVSIEAIFHLSIVGRTILFWTGVGSICGLAIFNLYDPIAVKLRLKAPITDEEISKRIGNHYPTISDRLLNTLQLARPLFTRESNLLGSSALALAAFNTTYETTRTFDFGVIVDERPLKRALVFFFGSLVVALAIFFGFRSEMVSATSRIVHYSTFYQKPAPFIFDVKPGSVRLMRGDSIHIGISTRGEQLKQLTLRLREEGQKEFDTIKLNASQAADTTKPARIQRLFSYESRVQHPIEYFAEAEGIESDHFKVDILDHPIVRSLSVTSMPPSYTREKPVVLNENFGDIAGVTGTRGEFRVLSSKPLRSARIVFQPTEAEAPIDSLNAGTTGAQTKLPAQAFNLEISDTAAHGSVTFMRTGSYHIELLDTDSIASEHPIEYSVSITRDEPPSIALIEPQGRADLPNDLRLQMLARVHDDFGFRGVRLGYRLTKSKFRPEEKEYRWLEVPLANYNTQDLDVPYIWNLTKLDLAPEDEVGYVLEVADNDAVTGPKRVRTEEFTVRYPSVKEIFERANEEASHVEKNLNEIKQDASELKKKVDDAVNEMRQTESANIAKEQQEFSKQKDVQQILERQEQLNKRVDDVAKQLNQMTKAMEQQNALSPETMQKYQELQKLFEQINSPELKNAMKQLEQAMKNVDPKQLQEAMKNVQFNEENFKKSIERTANILKRIQMEQKVDELTKRTAELARQEDRASQDQKAAAQNPQSQTPQDKAQAARQQQDAQKELDRLQKEAQDLAKEMKKLPQNMQAPDEMKDAEEALSDPSNQQSMQDAQDASEQGDHDRASSRSKDASEKMRQAQQKLMQLKRKLSESEKKRTERELRQIRDELNRLSKAEEGIKHQASEAQPNSNVFRDLADQQSARKDELGQTASKALELAQHSTTVSPEMGKAMGEAFSQMQKAEESMTDREQSGSEQSSQGAMTALNEAAKQTQAAMDGMNKGGKQKGQGSGGEGEGEEGDQPGGDNPGDGSSPGSAMSQFLSSIQKLTAQQKALNDMMSGMQGQAGGAQAQKQLMEQQAQIAKLAAQQQTVQKSMEDLAHEQQTSQAGNKLAAENLKKIADEMQDVISDMQSSGVRPETIQRQERILSRLLEAQRSVHERDKDEQRESKAGETISHQSPRELDLSTPDGRRELQDELNKARETGYSKDYEALIRKYFDAMQKAGMRPAQ